MNRVFLLVLISVIPTGLSYAKEKIHTFRDCPDCPEMVVLPAGQFQMGNGPNEMRWSLQSLPKHKAVIGKAFALGKYEVTRGQFRRFVEETGYEVLDCTTWDGQNPVRVPGSSWLNQHEQTDEHPVSCVSWNDAQAYVGWLAKKTGQQYRLPSTMEWEYASRAGTQTLRYWGDASELACNYENVADQDAFDGLQQPGLERAALHGCRDGYLNTAPVGHFQANNFGLHDMLGNVREWVSNCASPRDRTPRNGDACTFHVLRGGDFLSPPFIVRSATYDIGNETHNLLRSGFRVAKTLKP